MRNPFAQKARAQAAYQEYTTPHVVLLPTPLPFRDRAGQKYEVLGAKVVREETFVIYRNVDDWAHLGDRSLAVRRFRDYIESGEISWRD